LIKEIVKEEIKRDGEEEGNEGKGNVRRGE
jgi:hypothetical protein